MQTEEYAQIKKSFYKTTMCYWYLRKRCIFTQERCKYAHGVNDLKLLSHEEHNKIMAQFLSMKEQRWQLKGIQPKRKEQYKTKSCVDDLLFSSDEEDFNRLYVKKNIVRTNSEKAMLKEFYYSNSVSLINKLLSNQKMRRKAEIETIASDVQIHLNWKELTDKCIVYFKNILPTPSAKKKEEMVFPFPTVSEIETYMENLYTSIFVAGINELPLQSEYLIKLMYTQSKDNFLPLFTIARFVYAIISMGSSL
jgi:hypothetical protein